MAFSNFASRRGDEGVDGRGRGRSWRDVAPLLVLKRRVVGGEEDFYEVPMAEAGVEGQGLVMCDLVDFWARCSWGARRLRR
jgi:hypothetical protein